ncbi:c-type cytochrome [Arhodomonas sp. AD133]|uniref:c-type cytochrome n=1 Tax=Arhodomonas sp. AD133 TaxID=3415009 RepID=UPI003EB739C0
MKTRKRIVTLTLAVLTAAAGLALLGPGSQWAAAHTEPHTAEELKIFRQVFMEYVVLGDKLFHGDPAAQEELDVTLSETGMACAMCHPSNVDVHPNEFPKYQEQMQEFATLRDMINWCIENPNQGITVPHDSRAMRALEAYIYWSSRGSPLAPGVH